MEWKSKCWQSQNCNANKANTYDQHPSISLAFVEAWIIDPVFFPLRMHKIEESFGHEVQRPQAFVNWPHTRSILCLLHQNLRFRSRRGVLDQIRTGKSGHQRANTRTGLVPHQDKENRGGGSGTHRFQSSTTPGIQRFLRQTALGLTTATFSMYWHPIDALNAQ